MARTITIVFAGLAILLLLGDAYAGNCRQFFHHHAVVQPVIAQPLVLYQAGRDIELEALAERVAQRIEQRLQLRQSQTETRSQANRSQSAIAEHCAKCHSGATPKAGIVYDGITMLQSRHIVGALRTIADGSMPKDHKLVPEAKAAIMEELLTLEAKEGER
jgi:cytochrome c553